AGRTSPSRLQPGRRPRAETTESILAARETTRACPAEVSRKRWTPGRRPLPGLRTRRTPAGARADRAERGTTVRRRGAGEAPSRLLPSSAQRSRVRERGGRP